MTDPGAALDPERVQRILASFAPATDRLQVAVVDVAGDRIAESTAHAAFISADGPAAGHELALDIHCAGGLVGRVLASGPAIADPTVVAALDALAAGLGELAEADYRALRSELAQARLAQRSFVSLRGPVVPGYDLASHYEAAREIGGDFFELFHVQRRRRPIGVVIADVTGKGIGAGMLMAFARPVIHAALDHSPGPAEALERTNRILVDEIRSGMFITAIAGVLDVTTGRLRIANAGHEPPLLVPGDDGPIDAIEGGGVLLGAFRSLGAPELDIRLRPGDSLVLYTDGVTDAIGPSGERFGERRLLTTIEADRRGSAHDIVDAVRDAVAEFRGTVPPADDVTIVVIGRQRP
jgi:sigma-B regulation protein RsbU (phosphoserine phosphatase)